MLPPVGTRVALRYRLPAGSVPPLSDVVGHLLDTGSVVRVRTKSGAVVDVSPADVVAVRALTDVPVRTSQIRNLEHAAALAWPGVEQQWIDGWLCRFGHGSTRRANSAVPLLISATRDVRAIISWYDERGVPPLLAVPDRLFRLPEGLPVEGETAVMTADVTVEPATEVSTAAQPDDRWLGIYRRDVPVDVLTAVVDGEVAFATRAGAAVGRGAVTTSPDGTRWAGLSAVHVSDGHRREGHARAVGSALLAWAASQGATRAYVQALADNTAATRLYASMGFGVHHRGRYVDARRLLPRRA